MPTASRLSLCLALVAPLALWGCGGSKGAIAPPPPPAASLAVFASSTVAPVGTPVTITVNVVVADGAPVASGTPVAFTATGGTLSAVTPTGPAGNATATLSSAAGGTVTVTAAVGALAPRSVAVRFIDPNAPFAVSLVPAAARAAVRAPVLLTATVRPAGTDGAGGAGGAVPDGTVVAFTTSAGTLSAVTTTTGGVATALLEGVVAPAEVTVRAAVGTLASPPATIAFTDASQPQAVTLLATPAAGVAAGQRPVTLTAVVSPADPAGGAVADGTPVTFTVVSGAGTLSSPVAATVGGAASVQLDAAAAGTVGVTARAGTVTSAAVAVAFAAPVPLEPAALTVLASSTAAQVGAPVVVTATVVTAGGAPVPAGTPVGFSASGGVLTAITPTGPAGSATATLSSGAAGLVTVTCSVGALAPRTVTVRFIDPNAPFAVTLATSAARADVGAPVLLTATVRAAGADGAGGPGGAVADGTVVAFSTSAGSLSAVSTTVGGVASAVLGGVLAPGEVVVRAAVGGLASPAATVAFSDPDLPARLTASAAPAAGFVGGLRPVVVTALVERAAGGPVPAGTLVTFAVASGSAGLSRASALTGPAGDATTTVDAAVEGPVRVVASAGAAADAVDLSFTDPSKPQAVTLVASPGSGLAAGRRPVTLTAVVAPADPVAGRIADGTAVTFAVVSGGGTLSAPVATTLNGSASVTLDAAAAGSVSVTARAGAVTSAAVAVPFAAPPPSDPAALTVLASSTAALVGTPVTITASVVTSDGAPVASGTPVGFSATGGVLSAVTATGPAGSATASLTSAAAGLVTVTCSVGALPARTVAVRFIDPDAPFAVTLAASSTRADVGAAVLLTATVRAAGADGAGGPGGAVADGTVVAFTASAGTLTAVTTTVGGVASAVLDGVLAPADVVVQAAVGALSSPAETIAFSDPDRPALVSASAAPAAGFIGGLRPVVVTAHVERAAGGPVPAGTLVTFAVTSGPGSLSPASALTGPDGDARTTLDATAEGAVTVVAGVAGGPSDGVTVSFTDPGKPIGLALFANPGAGVANGLQPVTLTAIVSPADPVAGAIADGTPVTFTITSGAGTLSATSDGTVNGVASVDLDAAVAGSVSVTARVGVAPPVDSNAVTVAFVVQPTQAVVTLRTVGAVPPGAAIGGVSAVLTAAPAVGLACAATDHVASGVAANALLVANPADLANDRVALIDAAGMAAGQIATITCQVARGAFPTPQDFSVRLEGPGVIDLEGVTLAGLTVAIQSVDVR